MRNIGARPYWIMVCAGLALRLAIAPWGGHPGDLATLAGWAAALGEHGLPAVYITSDANYPPLALAILAISLRAYRLLGGGELAGPMWWVLLKLPAILADMGIVLLVLRLAPLKHRSPWLAASLVFNPAMIILSAWWGQVESLYMLGALAALIAAAAHRPFWAGLSLGLGMMVKLQAAVIAPVVLLVVLLEAWNTRPFCLYSFRVCRRQDEQRVMSNVPMPPVFPNPQSPTPNPQSPFRFAAGLVLPVALALGPYVWMGQGELVSRRLVALVTGPGWPTVNALNAWYLLTGGAGNWAYNVPLTWPDTAPIMAGVSTRAIGASMLAAWTIAVLMLIWRRLAAPRTFQSIDEDVGARYIVPLLQGGAMLYLGVFLWPTQAHERYVFGVVVLLAGAAMTRRKTWTWHSALYILITCACAFNLIWAAPFAPWLEGWFAGGHIVGNIVALMFIATAACGIWGMAES